MVECARCPQNLINTKELGHYGNVVSGAELDLAAEQRLAEHAAATKSSRLLIAALQERERDASGRAQHASQQQVAPQPKQGPHKLSKRARQNQRKASRLAGIDGVESTATSIGKTRCHRPLHLTDTTPGANPTVEASGTRHPACAASSAPLTTTTTI